MASGAAFRYLADRLGTSTRSSGRTFAMKDGQIQRWATVSSNVSRRAPGAPARCGRGWRTREWRPSVVDHRLRAALAALRRVRRTPLVAVDNINMLDRCHHDAEIVGAEREDF